MKIRDELLTEVKSYADNTPPATADMLECSLGVNPYGFSPAVERAFAQYDVRRFSHYPHSLSLQAALADYWSPCAQLRPENIVLTDGSIAALYLLTNVFMRPGGVVQGFLPTFTNMAEYIRLVSMRYEGIAGRPADAFAMDAERLAGSLRPETVLVYIDRPNNPTGQTMPLDAVRRVAQVCARLDICLLVDEAYGDFIPREESAISLFPAFRNLIVVRTFSKGLGLAGLRAGYIVAHEEITACLGKLANPYMMNDLAREMTRASLTDASWGIRHAPDMAAQKQRIRQAGGDVLRMAATDDRVPIFLLCHRDPAADLAALLLQEGVVVCSGGEFAPLDRSSARICVPTAEEGHRLLAAVERICRS